MIFTETGRLSCSSSGSLSPLPTTGSPTMFQTSLEIGEKWKLNLNLVEDQYVMTQISELHHGRRYWAGSLPSRLYHPWRVGESFTGGWMGIYQPVFSHQVGSKASFDHLSGHQVASIKSPWNRFCVIWTVLPVTWFISFWCIFWQRGTVYCTHLCQNLCPSGCLWCRLSSKQLFWPIIIINNVIKMIFSLLVTGLALIGKAAIVSCFCAIFMYRSTITRSIV